jgi:hypothetical protein
LYPKIAALKGSKISAERNRNRALTLYYEHPQKCLFCSQIITINPGQKIPQVKKRKFCSRSCAASYNNARFPKRKSIYSNISESPCTICGDSIPLIKRNNSQYYLRKRCDKCLHVKSNRVRYKNRVLPNIGHLTKKELFSKYGTWQSARSSILQHASVIFHISDKPKKCCVCGYSKHIQICHMKSVSSFDENSLISEINEIKNLNAFCPTHHWEFDNNALDPAHYQIIQNIL